ncbi:hypothetical protein evm_013500 [Chilo suppressalis]|nr:hypothetical protein evm_013500 [Chilo suppressalis]
MYLAVCTRPDIAHTVSQLSQFNNSYGDEHWIAAKRVLRYLMGTKDLALFYRRGNQNEFVLGYADADHAGDFDRRSNSGWVFLSQGGAISWESKKQRTVAISSAEAEYVALSEAAKEAIFIRRFIAELRDGPNPAISIFTDSQSAMAIAKNPVHHQRTKHVDVRYHFVREAIENGDIHLRRARGVRAACSQECGAGSWARRSEGERARCCWTCVPCATLAVTAPAGCRLCPPGHRPDALRKECIPSPIEWGGGGRWARAVSLAAGGGGLAAVCVCAATFWRHRATPVVKSASRELCALLLCAAAACHCAALAAVARPAPTVCAAVRLAAPALGGVYAAVLVRTVRVARLVQAAERRPAARPRLLSSRAQVWTWAALSGPGVATAAWSALRWPATPQLLHPGRARAVLVCGGELAPAQLVPLAPALALLASCVALAIRTRRLPHNFNETKFVGAAAYATCVTWVAFFPLYAATEVRTATLCACVSLSAGACVALSLGPRVWVCVFRPERNTRAHFLTATSIRCHLGKYRPGSDAPAGSLNSPRKCAELRDASCQVTGDNNSDQRSSAAGGWCEASGVCARVTRIPVAAAAPATADPEPARVACDPDDADATNVADVLIVLFHHRHALHSPLLETANKNHANSDPI